MTTARNSDDAAREMAPISAILAGGIPAVVAGNERDAPAAQEPHESPTRCCHCGGAGYFTEQVPFGHAHFGKLFPCVCRLAEWEGRRRREMLRLSNLDAFRGMTFKSFDPKVKGVRRAYLQGREYAETMQGWLALFRSFGVGKTHLAAAIANEALQRNIGVIFAVVPDLLDHLPATFAPSSPVSYDERFELIRNAPLLILDDLGTESATAWAREKLYQMSIIATTSGMRRCSPRIRSRTRLIGESSRGCATRV